MVGHRRRDLGTGEHADPVFPQVRMSVDVGEDFQALGRASLPNRVHSMPGEPHDASGEGIGIDVVVEDSHPHPPAGGAPLAEQEGAAFPDTATAAPELPE